MSRDHAPHLPSAAEVRVVHVSSGWEGQYQEFVLGHPSSLFYYSLRFRNFLTNLLRCEERYVIALRGGQVVGALPLMMIEGPFGRVLNSLPYFGSNGGILASDPAAEAALTDWYRAQVTDQTIAAATIISNPFESGTSMSLPHDFEDQRISLVTALAASTKPHEWVLERIDSSARRNVHKAFRSGVTVSVENNELLALEVIHRENMTRIGGQVKTTAFFVGVADHFRPHDDYDVYIARINDQVVAALLLFYFGQTVEYYVPAIHVSFRSQQPLAAILHRAMTDVIERGFRRWNWGGCWLTQESLIRFKMKWGGQQRIYRYWTKLNCQDLLSVQAEELAAAYPSFYIVPFSSLAAGTKSLDQ